MEEHRIQVALLSKDRWGEPGHPLTLQSTPCCGTMSNSSELGRSLAQRSCVLEWVGNWQTTVTAADVDVIAIWSPSSSQSKLLRTTLAVEKRMLCQKFGVLDFRDTSRASELIENGGSRINVGPTFSYSHGTRYIRTLIDKGFVNGPSIVSGCNQNSWLFDRQVFLHQVYPFSTSTSFRTSLMSLWIVVSETRATLSIGPGCKSASTLWTAFARSDGR